MPVPAPPGCRNNPAHGAVPVAAPRAGPTPGGDGRPGLRVLPDRPVPYSFTAPALTFMIRFWKMKKTTATGIVISAAAPSFSGYCVPWLS